MTVLSEPETAASSPAADVGRVVVAMQVEALSRRGGGLPGAVLPLARRRPAGPVSLVTLHPPEQQFDVPVMVPRRIGRLSLNALRLLESSGAGLVHTHGLWTTLSAAAVAWRRRTNGPTIVSAHGMLEPWALNKSRWRKRAALWALERAHLEGSACIHALNAAEAAAIRKVGFRAPIVVVPNGVEPVGEAERAQALAQRPGWMDRPVLLYLGRLAPQKGLCELIDAWAVASRRLPGWRLAIAGWGGGEADVRARARSAGADIVFPGPLFGAERSAAYANAAAFVLPSRSEGLPLTVLEAWSHGRPVLMTDACNLPEGFAAGAAARLELEPARMAEALVARLGDAAWLARAGARGQALVAERYEWEHIAETWGAIYRWASGLGPRPSAAFYD